MAINASAAFKSAMKAPVKQLKTTITLTSEGDTQTYTGEDELVSLNVATSGNYFTAATGAIDFTLLGTSYSLLGYRAAVQLSVLIDADNDTWSSINIGLYRITEQTADLEKGITKLKGVDALGYLASLAYSSATIQYPLTVADLAQAVVANNTGVDLATDVSLLPNGTYSIAEDLYANINNATLRDVMGEIAGATASLCGAVDGTGDVLFVEPQMVSSETLTYDNLKSVKLLDKYGAINTVVLSRQPQEDNVVESDPLADTPIEIKLANNEILDDDRETLITPIFNAINGFWYYPFEATTEGHGWHTVGDRITITDGVNSWQVIITEVKLSLGGGITETIKGEALTESKTNYALAGGITKTIYNTEIKVDKQNQEISSIVSQLDQLGDEVAENYTIVNQTINNLTTTIQETGGGNLIFNSVGYDTNASGGGLVDWTNVGTITSSTSPESISYGAVSGNQINLGVSSSITQRVVVDATSGQKYSLSFKAKKSLLGNATVRLTNSIDDYRVELASGTAYTWQSFELKDITASEDYFDVVVETDANIDEFAITDLMLNMGDTTMLWVQASGEILNTQVAVTKNGVKVKSSVYDGDYVEITPLGFNGYSDAGGSTQTVFSLNRDTTVVQKLHSEKQIEMPPLKVISITGGSAQGWAFVKKDN